MTFNHYNWKNGPAEIQQHSVAKLDVLRAYLIQYFKTLASLPQQDVFKLTLVDGFAGGGLYIHKDKQEFVHGSPLVCLEAVQEAEFLLNQGRKKHLQLDVDFVFVEENKDQLGEYLNQAQSLISGSEGIGNLVDKVKGLF